MGGNQTAIKYKTTMKANIVTTFIILLLGYSCYEMWKMYQKERKEKDRVLQSFEAAESTIELHKTRSGELVAQNQVLQLQYDEMKKIYPQILDEIKNLDINPRNVTHYSKTEVKQDKEIQTVIRDSVIMDTIPARVFSYQDEFYQIKGIAIGDSQKVQISSTDRIIQVVYKGQRIHPWLWFLSKRKLEQTISCKNPNSTILYNKNIQILK